MEVTDHNLSCRATIKLWNGVVRDIPNEQELVLIRNLQVASLRARNGVEMKSLNSTTMTDITVSNSVVLLHMIAPHSNNSYV